MGSCCSSRASETELDIDTVSQPILTIGKLEICSLCSDCSRIKTVFDPCQHQFCYDCISLEERDQCPLCMRKLELAFNGTASDQNTEELNFAENQTSDDDRPNAVDILHNGRIRSSDSFPTTAVSPMTSSNSSSFDATFGQIDQIMPGPSCGTYDWEEIDALLAALLALGQSVAPEPLSSDHVGSLDVAESSTFESLRISSSDSFPTTDMSAMTSSNSSSLDATFGQIVQIMPGPSDGTVGHFSHEEEDSTLQWLLQSDATEPISSDHLRSSVAVESYTNSAVLAEEESEICAICRYDVQSTAVLCPCMHRFCYGCIVTWSAEKTECPVCRTEFGFLFCNLVGDCDYQICLFSESQGI